MLKKVYSSGSAVVRRGHSAPDEWAFGPVSATGLLLDKVGPNGFGLPPITAG